MSKKALVQITKTSAETERFAAKFAKGLKPGAVLLLTGELGSGKTTFVKGLAKGLGISQEILIHSPSFTLINEYPGKIPLYHVDLYRLEHMREIEELGLGDYFEMGGVVAVEWADRDERFWPSQAVKVHFKILPFHQREIGISFGPLQEK